ncbi:MAG TPA: response regulator [Burkholderiales bacterium]|nr:response regulator [Burkholderiales bacterium]
MRAAAAHLRDVPPSLGHRGRFSAAAFSTLLHLPRQEEQLASDFDLQAQHPAILVVQDNRFLREMICDWLGGAGYIVHAAGDAHDALAWLNRRRFDLVVLELDLPRSDGMSLLRAVESKLSGTPMVVLTGSVSYDDLLASIPAEVPYVRIGKPYSFLTLGLVVKAALARSRGGRPPGSGSSASVCS